MMNSLDLPVHHRIPTAHCLLSATSQQTARDEVTSASLRWAFGNITEAPLGLVVDVTVANHGECVSYLDGVQARGVNVTVGSACYAHVHGDTLNVYDFSYWAVAHPGNQYSSYPY